MPEKDSLSESLHQINKAVSSGKFSLGGWTLSSYQKFLAGLPGKVKDIMEVEEGDKKLVLSDLHYKVQEDIIDPNRISKLKDEGADLSIPLKGSFSLIKDGKVISKTGPKLITNIPFPTDNGTFVIGGQDFNLVKQLRLSPGVYTTKGSDGKIKSQFNTKTRQNFDITFDPDKSNFTFKIAGKSIPIHTVMSVMGVSDDAMQKAWGQSIFTKARKKNKGRKDGITKLFHAMYRYDTPGTMEENVSKIREAFRSTELDPWVTKITLGKEYGTVNGDALLNATRKAIGVSSGKVEEDEREALHFKAPFNIGSMVNYALDLKGKNIRNKVKMRLRKTEDINSIISRPLTTLSSTIKRKYNEDDLARTPDQHNPLGIYGDNTEITFLGEGGITDYNQITDKARGVHDSALGFLDPIHSPEGGNVGMNVHLSSRAKLKGDRLIQSVVDRAGNSIDVGPRDIYDKYVAIPGQVKFKNGMPKINPRKDVDALYHGKLIKVPASKIDMVMPGSPGSTFGAGAMTPFLGNDMTIRAGVGVKQLGQALALKDREAPLTQTIGDDGEPIGSTFYRRMNPTAPDDMPPGVVKKITDTNVFIEDSKGETHRIPMKRDYQLNGDVTINETPIVQVGDKINPGQVLAENQFSKNKHVAIGKNLDVAFMSYYGLNHQDGIVVSEEAAKKLTSTHSYENETSKSSHDVFDKKKFLAHYPTLYNKKALSRLDNDGVARVGQAIEPGDPIVLKMTPQTLSEDDILMGRINRAFKDPLKRDEKTWDGDHPAIVSKVVKIKKGIKVFLKTEEPAQVGDKITNLHGAKGVITSILPRDEMPQYEDGTTPDVLQNPAAIPSRMNSGQYLEILSGRIAKATGKPYKIKNFHDDINAGTLAQEMFNLGLAEKDDKGEIDVKRSLTLPNGRQVRISSGPQYVSKLKQQAASYYAARGRKGKYDATSRSPVKGPSTSALGMYSMLAHGATANLKELTGWKSERNDDIWRAYETGQPLPSPKTTFAMDRMIGILNAAGINVGEQGSNNRIMPLTDSDVDEMSSGEVPDPARSVRIGKSGDMETLESQDGGLYDQKVFGGMQGTQYGHITLASPMPNPVFETPVRKLTGLTGADYDALVEGEKGVLHGKVVDITPDNKKLVKTRGEAFQELLGSIDVEAQMKDLGQQYKTTRGQNRNVVADKLKYLAGLKRSGKQPTDYLISKIPVIPPQFRPVYLRDDGSIGVSDLTLLYQRAGVYNQALKDAKGLPRSVVNKSYGELYEAVKELQTTGREDGGRKVQGATEFLKGKSGHFMKKILGKREALGGLATIMPDPKLDIDQIKIPEDMAWEDFESPLMRRMVQSGIDAPTAAQLIEERSSMASSMLDSVMEDYPVILRRDPKLHKFNSMAFKAKRTPGKAIYLPPLVTKGFNADFDGDRMSLTVPITEAASKEAWEKMRPSANLLKPGKDSPIITPTEETIAGLYAASKVKKNTGLKFGTSKDVLKALDEGKIDYRDGIQVGDAKTTVGTVKAMENFPEEMRDYSMLMTDGNIKGLLKRLAEEKPRAYSKAIMGLKDAGDTMVTEMGLSFSAKDFTPLKDTRELDKLRRGGTLTAADRKNIEKRLRGHLGDDSIMAMMADSGAKGSWGNIQQMLYSPIQVQDASGKTTKHIIGRGYAAGMNFRDYWEAAKGGRKGMIDKGVETARPGYFGKEILRSTIDYLVQKGDGDGEVEGLEYGVDNPTVLNRYLAADVKDSAGKVIAHAGDPVTSQTVQMAKRMKIKNLSVRSPMTTRAYDGVYAKDFGRLPGNKKPRPGTNIGTIAGHTLTEPATQLTLKKFHSGGSGEASQVAGLDNAWDILKGKAPKGTKAAMASEATKVSRINTLPSGAREILFTNGKKAYAAPGRKILVKPGQAVNRGDQLQDGNPSPQDVLKYKGLRAMQMYMVDQLEKSYGKHAPDRRYLEAVVGSVTRYAEVNDPGDSDYTPGEIVPINHLKKYNDKRGEALPVNFKPRFLGIGPSGVKAKQSWAGALLHGDIGRRLPDLAAQGAVAPIHGQDPIMPMIYSSEFGDKTEEGEY